MAINDFLTFAGDPAANVMTQSDYLASGFTARLLGFSDGTGYMAARFAVVDPSVASWWPARRREHSRAYVATLESHALPTLWWVADGPVRVVRDLDWQDPAPWRRDPRK